MFIAVNANKRPLRSEERKADYAYHLSRLPLLRTEKELLTATIYKHLAPNGATRDRIRLAY